MSIDETNKEDPKLVHEGEDFKRLGYIQKLDQQQQQQQQTDPDLDDVLANQDQEKIKEFDESKYQGYDGLVQYYSDNGSAKAQIHIKLSKLDIFRVPYNVSGDYTLPRFQLMDLKYHSVTTKAYDERHILLAEVDDLTRAQQVQQLKLQEFQTALQKRTADRFRPPTELAGRKTLDQMTVEEIQEEIKTLEQIDLNISRKIQEKRIEANRLGFKIYFHIKDNDVYDNCRSDQLEDILKGCDQKQIGVAAAKSKNFSSSLSSHRQGTG